MAVGKTFPPPISAQYAAGQRDFGENYIQEWAAKADELAVAPILCGILSAKCNPIKPGKWPERAHRVHTIERLKTAQRLSDRRPG